MGFNGLLLEIDCFLVQPIRLLSIAYVFHDKRTLSCGLRRITVALVRAMYCILHTVQPIGVFYLINFFMV